MSLSNKAFTLIELLVVIVIIGILATISVSTFNGYFAKERDAQRMSDLRSMSKAVELYRVEHEFYPSTNNLWWDICSTFGNRTDYIPGLAPKYIDELRYDPSGNTLGSNCYVYRSNGDDYMILANQVMESVVGGDPSAPGNSASMQSMDRKDRTQPSIAIYSPGAEMW